MKPIKFEKRKIGAGHTIYVHANELFIGHPNYWMAFDLAAVRALEKACAEFTTAHREALRLTFADLKPGEYFRLKSDPLGAVRRKLVPGEYWRFPEATIPPDEPVFRLEVTIEIVE